MEKLVINIPDKKSALVKRVLHALGVTVPGIDQPLKNGYREKLLNVSEWTHADTDAIEEAGESLNNLKSEEW